ncbi:hypothetical protein [Noviherbaspirillum galbum]|uniref:Uncharacterized protein n=1 Tax=Noviherbaspirillum galbum TaxID=2709383 RepID=A0A6B3SG90_9BURK|nr:hypothetical protein [Noviherbaspirillum galbum]NEX59658.1 hypothetical protein [Noviherbaspirillum galbum]
MMASKGIIIVRQAGSAAALLPVADELAESEPDCHLTVIAFPPSASTCREIARRADRYALHVVQDEDEARARFHEQIDNASFLLTGTSAEAEADAYYWREARKRGVENFGYLDQWVNIEQRFPGMTRDDWPDHLAVLDEHDLKMAASIAPEGVALHVSGSPALANIQRQVKALREAGIQAEPARILFATEPAADLDAYRAINGFNDEDSFDWAVELVRRRHPGATLVLRLHPRDGRERWLPRLPGDVSVVWDELSRAESLARAGLVLGMRSFFLLEAHACAIPVISLQPQRRTACPLTDGRMTVITNLESLPS